MRNKITKYIALLLIGYCGWSCTPEKAEVYDIDAIEIAKVDSIAIAPNYKMLIADGKATLDFRPQLFSKNNGEVFQIPEHRIKNEWLQYSVIGGKNIQRTYATSDKSLIGKTQKVVLSLNGSNVKPDTLEFRVVAPLEKEYQKDVTFPIVFHIIQTKEEIETFGVKYTKERIMQFLEKINAVFAGEASNNPIGVNTHITFKPAIYSPKGAKLREEGINRIVVDNIKIGKDGTFDHIIKDNELFWSSKQYLNVWLLSDFADEFKVFGTLFSNNFKPKYAKLTMPEFIGMSPKLRALLAIEPYMEQELEVKQSGVLYKLQSLNISEKQYSNGIGMPIDNELIYYIGRYFGLRNTYEGPDLCDDTHDYDIDENKSSYKKANDCYFLSENIMDDASGMHTFVSKDQAKVIRWVLEHCPERAAWKSTFAFKGE